MRDVTFYRERTGARNVWAVFRTHDDASEHKALGPVDSDEPDSEVELTRVHDTFLTNRCRRVGERIAREAHPALFDALDAMSDDEEPESHPMCWLGAS